MTRIKNREHSRIKTPLPIIGKVRIGDKKQTQGGKEYPISLDYFRATGKYADMFHNIYGNQPDQIQVIFISDDDNVSCNEYWEGREKKTGALAGKSDGETYDLWDYEGQSGYKSTTSKQKVKDFTKQHGIQWSVILTLNFIIPAIKGVFGMWQFQTKGTKSSIESIINTYDGMKQEAGTVVNIPFDLVVKKVEGQKPGEKRVFPVVDLIPNISSQNIAILRQWLSQGGDVKDLGIIDDKKLDQLQEHEPKAIEKSKEDEPKKTTKKSKDNKEQTLFPDEEG
jgi:hypothetical protein